ncbi:MULTISPECIES: haloacid dehalogenase type II [unclassified Amycolatopsis]|uniref:haloacid dehalogenase type II n=1 Tax=unclassified Amycolatopsis TaxID=2618356 RepID=UPI001C6A1AC0|nr:haloacid dehalogenase type II [Amycolatopsis sp. DSM 110486]QYN22107.1 haloacid dehalogenase type II [Amycolatopsis sp. DSM 110486]
MFDVSEVAVVAVDVFGTTVDWRTGVIDGVAAIAEHHETEFDCPALVDAWRERYLPAVGQINRGEREWANLDAVHREALDECLELFGVAGKFGAEARERMVRAWDALPPWPDAVEGLAELRRDFVVVALSNGGFAQLIHVVKGAGLGFDAILSAENVGAYKPDRRAYTNAAKLLDVEPRTILMVAAHTWDIHGARDAGFRTAFVERPGEKGPDRPVDTAETTDCDLSAVSFADLAGRLRAAAKGGAAVR